MNADLAVHADLQLQAMALVDAFREHRIADRDYIINQADVADLMTGLALYAMKLECAGAGLGHGPRRRCGRRCGRSSPNRRQRRDRPDEG